MKNVFKEVWFNVDVYAWAERRNPYIRYWWFVTELWQEFWYWLVMRRICQWRGHMLVDESYGNPESGAIDMHCTRCGQSWYQQLY